MHLAAYHFDGDTEQLQAGYDAVVAAMPADSLLLSLVVARPAGITVFDACPTIEDFESFSTSESFFSALKEAGLPSPRIESVGEIRAANGTML